MVATLLAQSMTEREIAKKLKVDQSTISSMLGIAPGAFCFQSYHSN
jgi:DNA-binding CsgD family transcriptional regulator